MAGRGNRPKGKGKASAARADGREGDAPERSTGGREIAAALRTRGRIELAGGALVLLAAVVITTQLPPTSALGAGTIALVLGMAIVGAVALAAGATRLDRRAEQPASADRRRRIYGVLALVFGGFYAYCVWKVIPNRLPSGMLHLSAVPIFMLLMAAGTLAGGRRGWWLAIVSGSLVLLATITLIARILASAAFVSGVYGAFGKGAAMFALVAVALIVELVVLLPMFQLKFLMTRAGRRACGLA